MSSISGYNTDNVCTALVLTGALSHSLLLRRSLEERSAFDGVPQL